MRRLSTLLAYAMLLLLTLSARGTAQETITLHKGKKHTYTYKYGEYHRRHYSQSKYLAQDTIFPKYIVAFIADPLKSTGHIEPGEFVTINPPKVNFSAGAKEILLDLLVEYLAPELIAEYRHIEELKRIAKKQNERVYTSELVYLYAWADMRGRITRIKLIHSSYSSMIIPVGKYEQFEEAVLKSGVRLEYDKRDKRFEGSTFIGEGMISSLSRVYERLQEKTKDKSSKYYGRDFSYLERASK